jgi:ribose transport system permease protein
MSSGTNELNVPRRSGLRPLNATVQYGLAALLCLLVGAFALLRPSFATADNASGLMLSASISAIMFLGLTWVLAAGEIDVSFVSVATLANMIVAGMVAAGHGWPFACAIALLASLAVGIANGVFVARMGLPALVVTIATGGIASALAAGIGFGSSIAISNTGFVGLIVTSQWGVVPVVSILAVGLYAVCWYGQEHLVFGRYIYALAQNRSAVIEAGVPAQRLLALLYVFTALSSGIAGILLTAQLASGQPSIAASMFLDGLTAVLLGGAMIKFGKPNVIGTGVGVLILAVLVRGGALLGWNDSAFQIIKGSLLLIGVATVIFAGDNK